jgi:SAM-dependent methyltransferase
MIETPMSGQDMTSHTYNSAFLQYAAQSSAYSSHVITSMLNAQLAVESVLDVGCAMGTWLHAWSESGVADYHGVDGDYVDRGKLEIPAAAFTAVDLNATFDLERKFDLVQSLEVAEHVEPRAADTFVDSLARHASRYILFSAAPPGQGGEFHINEQSYDFWREKLARRGFAAIDALRPMIADDTRISYWYRYNAFLFARRAALDGLPPGLRDKIVAEGAPLVDVSPLTFRVRKALVRQLPYGVQQEIARLKAHFLPTGRI